jgi:hypothetical protein
VPEQKRPSLPRRALRIVVVGTFVAFIGWALIRQWSEVTAVAGRLSAQALGLSFLAALAATWGGFFSWRAILADFGSRVPFTAGLRIFFVGQLAKYVPGKVWPMLTQARLGRDYRVPGRASAAAALIVLGTTLGTGLLVTAVLLPVLGGDAFDRYWWTVLVLPAAFVLLWPAVLNRLLDRAMRLARREPMPRPLTWRGIGASTGWALLVWLAFGVHLWVLLADLGVRSPDLLLRSIGAFAGSWAIGFLVAVAPAGVGGREVALIVLLRATVDQPTALVAAVVSRLLMTIADLASPALAVVLERRRLRGERQRAAAEG